MGDTSSPEARFCPICRATVEASLAISAKDGVQDAFLGEYESPETQAWDADGERKERPAAHVRIEAGEVRVYLHVDPDEEEW